MTRLTPATLTLLILLLATCGMAFLLALTPAAGHDQLWFLLMAQRILHGAAPYGPETFDSNPPAILWFSALPVYLAEHLHLPLAFTAKFLCLFLILTIALLLSRIRVPHPLHSNPKKSPLHPPQTRAPHPFEPHPKGWGIEPKARPSPPTAATPQTPTQPCLFFLLAFLLLTCVIPARDFGQRDHLAAILLLPYVLTAFYLTSRSPATRIVFPLLAALGVCLKPQQALVPLVLELALILRTRRLGSVPTRPAPWTFLTVGALYLAAIHRFAPLYFSVALPTTLSTYWAIGHLTPIELLRQAPQLHLLALLTLAFALRRRPIHPQVLALLLAGLAATAAYYLQATGWYYQQLPALIFFGLALAIIGCRRFDSLTVDPGITPSKPSLLNSPWLPPTTALLSLLALTLTFHFSGLPFTRQAFTEPYTNPILTPDPTFFERLPPGTPVATLTTSVDDAIMPVVRYHLTWAQRTNNLWTLPALLRSDPALNPGTPGSASPSPASKTHHLTPDRLATLEAQQHRWMVEDLLRWCPTLIFVARCQDPTVRCQTLEDRHDNLLAFFLRDPAFAAIFSHYHFLRTSGPYDAYTLN